MNDTGIVFANSSFMKSKLIICPYHSAYSDDFRIKIKKHGQYYRKSDRKKVQRFYCNFCRLYFSSGTISKNYRQKKRQLNHRVTELLASGVSQRIGSKILRINRKTFIRKFIVMGHRAKEKFLLENRKNYQKSLHIQFDDMETFEHTKCKPLSITIAVEENTRRILDYQVSQMSAKGLLTKIALKKYGYRPDYRKFGRQRLFKNLKEFISPSATIKTDENPHYLADVKKYFPLAIYKTYKGRKPAVTGQGELKKVGYDPIFSLNHTCATLRYRTSRLARRSWCTTKKPERLDLHLAIVALAHNKGLPTSATG